VRGFDDGQTNSPMGNRYRQDLVYMCVDIVLTNKAC